MKTYEAKNLRVNKNLPSSGDKENQIHMEGYQVSAQCMALVRDNCLVPTKDAPELGYVRESTDKQYVPDVFYKVSHQRKTRLHFLSLFSFIFFFISLIQLHFIGGLSLLETKQNVMSR